MVSFNFAARQVNANLLAFMVWAAVAASAVYWGLKFVIRATPAPAHADASASKTPLPQDLTRLVDVDRPAKPVAAAVAMDERSRFQLVGVVVPHSAQVVGQGVALIAIDGRPARPYKVGAVVDGGFVLQAVHSNGALIGSRDGTVAVSLVLPDLQSSATEGPTPVTSSDVAGAPVPPPASGLPVIRPPVMGINRLTGSAPNTLLNNPADMAPPDVTHNDGSVTR